MVMTVDQLRTLVRDIPDFPKPGIVFKDITPVLKSPEAFRLTIRLLAETFRARAPTAIVSMEARGFLFGAALAYELGCAFVPVRKPGKLPHKTLAMSYALEYGVDTLEVHADALGAGDCAVIVDDVLATGGTALAVADLIGRLGARVIGCGFLMELSFLHPREKLRGMDIYSILTY
jgi:adenine phosphoribosyltransferase